MCVRWWPAEGHRGQSFASGPGVPGFGEVSLVLEWVGAMEHSRAGIGSLFLPGLVGIQNINLRPYGVISLNTGLLYYVVKHLINSPLMPWQTQTFPTPVLERNRSPYRPQHSCPWEGRERRPISASSHSGSFSSPSSVPPTTSGKKRKDLTLTHVPPRVTGCLARG